MNQVLFEGRFLIEMIGTLMKKGTLQIRYARFDWERMFRMADYHHIANLVYLGILGNDGRVPERWMNRFFERYQESLLYGGTCEEDEKELLALLDMEKIPCVLLASTTIRRLYNLTELADTSPLRLYLSPEGYTQFKGYLVDLGYETTGKYPDFGEHMQRVSGLGVDIYYKLPFSSHFYEKEMRQLAIRAFIRDNGVTVRVLSVDDRFLFRLASAAYHYATDQLLIRELMDLYLYHKAWRKHLNDEYIHNKLEDFHVEGLADKLLRLSYMWFGAKEDKDYIQEIGQIEDTSVFDTLEYRILNRGRFVNETDPQALALMKLIERDDERERRKIKRQALRKGIADKWKSFGRGVRWAIPEYKYMCALYPILEKIPFLLPLFWVLRGLRLLAGMVKNGG